jgi:WD40 repeat protein
VWTRGHVFIQVCTYNLDKSVSNSGFVSNIHFVLLSQQALLYLCNQRKHALQVVRHPDCTFFRCPFCLLSYLSRESDKLQVRALSSPTNELILSASRDSTAISWQRPSPESPFAPASILKAGSRYVNSVAYIAPSPEAPKGWSMTLFLPHRLFRYLQVTLSPAVRTLL